MDYPNDFNVPAFSAGKTIAFTRTISIWILIVFFLIVAACGFLLLNMHMRRNFPFLISVNPITEDWTVITYPGEKEKPVQQYKYIQERLVHDFVKDWFNISGDTDVNEQIWKKCSFDECKQSRQFNPNNKVCAISCRSSEAVFTEFTEKVVPNYRARIQQAREKWAIPSKKTLINPVMASEKNSKWQVYATVNSSVMGSFDVLIFVDVERNIDLYPSTFGYYINQFNAYRIAQ